MKKIILVITPTYCRAGAPGQLMNWMPAPQAPMGCPPGLEYLSAIDQVLVQQQIELLEGIPLTYNLQSLVLSYTRVFKMIFLRN